MTSLNNFNSKNINYQQLTDIVSLIDSQSRLLSGVNNNGKGGSDA